MRSAGRGGATPYERARQDPQFLARFAREYRGPVAPLDALWWREHPDEAAPSGADAPAAALAALRREVYSSSARPGATERYRRLRSEQDRECEAVEDALARAEASCDPPVEPTAAPEAALVPPYQRAASPRVLLAALAVAAAFVAGVVAAPALGTGAPRPTASVTAVDTPPVSGSAGIGSALSIFAEPQQDFDRPPIDAGAGLLPHTFRRLDSLPARGVTVYAAQDTEGGVCLVALSLDARTAVACATIADLRHQPLRLTLRADVYRYESTKAGQQVQLTAVWGYSGGFTVDETPVQG